MLWLRRQPLKRFPSDRNFFPFTISINPPPSGLNAPILLTRDRVPKRSYLVFLPKNSPSFVILSVDLGRILAQFITNKLVLSLIEVVGYDLDKFILRRVVFTLCKMQYEDFHIMVILIRHPSPTLGSTLWYRKKHINMDHRGRQDG